MQKLATAMISTISPVSPLIALMPSDISYKKNNTLNPKNKLCEKGK